VYGHVAPSDAMPRAKAAAERALAIDDQLAEADASLGGVMMDYEWKFAESERHFRRAIALNPGYATAHQWLAELLSILGRSDEALAEIRRAEELDPLSLIISNVHGHIFLRARRYDEAIAQYRKTLELDSTFKLPYMWLMQAYEQKGMYADAIAAYRQAAPTAADNPRNIGNLGHVYASMGNRDEARKLLAQLIDMSKTRYVTPYAMAIVCAGLGDKEQAIAWLEKGYVDRHVAMAWLKVEPKFDNLRSDPRFQDLVRRVGLPQ
jgi:tetratricopeptide (TPR) repeat protein